MLSADNPFYRRVTLLVELLPLVARESCFALKGGTAINLFVHDLPRLSVDIDLTYLPIAQKSWKFPVAVIAGGNPVSQLRGQSHHIQRASRN